jgi:alkylation response protein AidB-like acyl-CoA dehydrogenase
VNQYRKKIVDMQFIQERLANIAIDVFVSTAVLSRTTWEIERAGSVDAARAQVDCAKIFVPMVYRRARRNIRALSTNQDERLHAIAEYSLATGDLGPEATTDV